MKIINLGRGMGKTTRLLYASEFNDYPILCATRSQKQDLIERAKVLRLNIPEPIVIDEITNKGQGSKVLEKDLLVDEAHWILQSLLKLLGAKGDVKAITITSSDLETKTN